MRTAVLGAGAWGTTLALVLVENGHEVTLWEFKEDYKDIIASHRENVTYLPGIALPDALTVTSDLHAAAADKDMIILAVPSQFLRSCLATIPASLIANSIIVSVSKGIEIGTNLTVSGIIKNVFPSIRGNQIAVLSGPSHAEEVSRKIPTAVVSASSDGETAHTVQAAFMNSYFRVYSSRDILGVELGGAFKNVIAIGAGIIDGVKYGDNTKAAIMTRGIAEISRLGIALGASPETFAGLSGMGDLIVTCMSRHSRNRYVGEKLGQGMKLEDILKGMTAVAEGIATSRSASELAKFHNVETPITNEVYRVLFENKDPVKATTDLMTRDKKPENV